MIPIEKHGFLHYEIHTPYFRFSLPPEAVSRHEIEEFVRHAKDREYVKHVFHNSLEVVRTEGRTKASYLLEALEKRSNDFSVSSIGPFLAGLFEMADALMDKGDEAGWARLTNYNRILFLVDALVKRVELQERSEMLREACQNASLGWLTNLTTTVESQHQSTNDEAPVDQPLTTKEDAARMREGNLRRIRRAADGNDLLAVHDLEWVLYRWHDLAGDNGTEAREWTTETMKSDQGVARLAQAFLGETRNRIARDSAPLQKDRAKIEHIDAVLDRDLFHKRLCQARSSDCLSADQRETITRLLRAWKKHEQNA